MFNHENYRHVIIRDRDWFLSKIFFRVNTFLVAKVKINILYIIIILNQVFRLREVKECWSNDERAYAHYELSIILLWRMYSESSQKLRLSSSIHYGTNPPTSDTCVAYIPPALLEVRSFSRKLEYLRRASSDEYFVFTMLGIEISIWLQNCR